MKKYSRNKGFTLVELLITVGILAILTSIAFPLYTGYIETARNVEGLNNIESLKAAQTEFYAENGTYFVGAATGALETNSQGYWKLAEAAGDEAFIYSVTAVDPTLDYTVMAKGGGPSGQVAATVELTYTQTN